MSLPQPTIAGLASATIKALFSGGLGVAVCVTAVTQTAQAFPHYKDFSGNKLQVAGPLDKSSPKIAHGMYKDRGKSSPKIAHGMYKEIDKSSPKIAHRTRRAPAPSLDPAVMNLVEIYFDALDAGKFELADEVGRRVDDLVRESGHDRG